MVWFWIQFWFRPWMRLCPPPSVRPGLAQKVPVLGFLLYSILKFFIIFEQGTPPFHLALGLTNHIPGPERGLNVFLCMCVQLCLTLCDPMDCGLSGSSVHGILQARILGWVAISSSRGSSWFRGSTRLFCVSCIGRRILYHWTTWEALSVYELIYKLNCREFSDLGSVTRKRTRGFTRWGRSTDLNAGASCSRRARSCSDCVQWGS